MIMKKTFFIICIIFFTFPNFLLVANEKTATGKLMIYLYGYTLIKGNMELNIFTNEAGFPNQHTKAYYHATLPVTATNTILILSNMNYGKYGISIFHDENKNKKLDTGFLGIPKEPYGFSNDARGKFGPPHFNETLFWIQTPLQQVNIKLK